MRTTRLTDMRRPASNEDGISLAEVVVAMLIFALVSTGIIYGLLSVKSLTRDARARQVASNLAAGEIDLARDTSDLFALLDRNQTKTLNGDKFYVHRATQWVTNPDLDISCGAGGSTGLRYKRVNVTVTWDAMRAGTKPVRADTVVQPDQKINDPAKGTILVSVLGGGGSGVGGVGVSAVPSTPANGALALATPPAPTDAQGCSYILKVTPGNYDVTVSKAGYIDADQKPTSTRTVGASAGASGAVQFQYDAKAVYKMTYGANYTPAGSETFIVPAQPTTTFTNTYGTYPVTPTVGSARTADIDRYPYASGYETFVGACANSDPAAWPAKSTGGHTWEGQRTAAVAATPGTSIANPVAMGVVKLNLGTLPSGRYLRAVSVAAPGGSDDPGCAPTTTYSFGTTTSLPTNGKVTVALPYGSWQLYYGSGTVVTAWTTAVTTSQMSVPSTPLTLSQVRSGNVVTLDPRVATS